MARSNIPAGYCDVCRTQLFVGNKYCPGCGSKVDTYTRVLPSGNTLTLSASNTALPHLPAAPHIAPRSSHIGPQNIDDITLPDSPFSILIVKVPASYEGETIITRDVLRADHTHSELWNKYADVEEYTTNEGEIIYAAVFYQLEALHSYIVCKPGEKPSLTAAQKRVTVYAGKISRVTLK